MEKLMWAIKNNKDDIIFSSDSFNDVVRYYKQIENDLDDKYYIDFIVIEF